jgi:hypothetical protein
MPANLPKSLHTVTVLVNVARVLRAPTETAESAVSRALIVLGYADTPDAYGLADKARAVLAVRA